MLELFELLDKNKTNIIIPHHGYRPILNNNQSIVSVSFLPDDFERRKNNER